MSGSDDIVPFAQSKGAEATAGDDAAKVVYIVDDDVDVRKSLHFALSTSDITVWPFGAPQDFLDQLATLKPAPILLDIRMPKIDGVQLLKMIRDRGIAWPVIMMTAHGDIPLAVATMKLGAVDFLEKPFSIDRLEELLDVAFAGLSDIVASAKRHQEASAKLASLTPRESDVVMRVARGLSNKSIASELGISHRTVEIHRGAALGKLGVKSMADVALLVREAGKA